MPGEELRDLRGRAEHWRLLAAQISDRCVLEAVTARLHRIEKQIVPLQIAQLQIAQLEAEIRQKTPTQNERSVAPAATGMPVTVGGGTVAGNYASGMDGDTKVLLVILPVAETAVISKIYTRVARSHLNS